ncbi:hypothetical protein [Bdellovibrio sp. HCB288]|uniref:hypothetical protein n=1 Tax=Bdellovibrio sp. HCB288 TaxID=3394355 RepID=UPI0039B65CA1
MKLDPLKLWNNSSSKDAIIDFVRRVTDSDSADFVRPEDRIAVFDNDGTLWCEKPLPVQADFMLRRIAEMAKKDPSLAKDQPWKAVSEKDYKWLSDAVCPFTEVFQPNNRLERLPLFSINEII